MCVGVCCEDDVWVVSAVCMFVCWCSVFVDSGVGAGIDSYYEYCLKTYILLGEEEYLKRFDAVSERGGEERETERYVCFSFFLL